MLKYALSTGVDDKYIGRSLLSKRDKMTFAELRDLAIRKDAVQKGLSINRKNDRNLSACPVFTIQNNENSNVDANDIVHDQKDYDVDDIFRDDDSYGSGYEFTND